MIALLRQLGEEGHDTDRIAMLGIRWQIFHFCMWRKPRRIATNKGKFCKKAKHEASDISISYKYSKDILIAYVLFPELKYLKNSSCTMYGSLEPSPFKDSQIPMILLSTFKVFSWLKLLLTKLNLIIVFPWKTRF